MKNDQTQHITNVVKLTINPLKVNKFLDDNKKETKNVIEMPSKRELGIFLKKDPKLISDWYFEKGHHCIEISNISFNQINELTQSHYFFSGHLVYVNYLSGKKVGYSEIENGSANTGWFVSRKFENWKQLKSEFKLSNQILDKVREYTDHDEFAGLSLYVNHRPKKEFKAHKERVNSISDYDLDQYTLTDLKANWEKNRDYRQLCERKSFKFFVNNQYMPAQLCQSLNEVINFDNRIGDPNGGVWSEAYQSN